MTVFQPFEIASRIMSFTYFVIIMYNFLAKGAL